MDQSAIDTAVGIVTAALIKAEVGPEMVIAIDPAEAGVDWDADPGAARADKMREIRSAVRIRLREMDVMHKLPQLLLVADDGACAELYGGIRTGTAVVIPDSMAVLDSQEGRN